MNSALRKNTAFAWSLMTLAWCSVLLQCFLSLQLSTQNGNSIGGGLETFFSYFTVLTNLLICLSLTFSLIRPSSAPGKWFSRPQIIAGIATSIAFVGLSYHFLLRNTWNPQGAQLLADVLLHYVVPALYMLYWWVEYSKAPLRWMHPSLWSVYPTHVLGLRIDSWKHARHLPLPLYQCRPPRLRADDAQLRRPVVRVHRLGIAVRRAE